MTHYISEWLSPDVADSVGLHISDLAMIDDGDSHAVRMSLVHDLVYLCIDCGSARHCLCDNFYGEPQNNTREH
jgi:hypothetical protein